MGLKIGIAIALVLGTQALGGFGLVRATELDSRILSKVYSDHRQEVREGSFAARKAAASRNAAARETAVASVPADAGKKTEGASRALASAPGERGRVPAARTGAVAVSDSPVALRGGVNAPHDSSKIAPAKATPKIVARVQAKRADRAAAAQTVPTVHH